MNNIESEGKCYYCKETYSGKGISRHLSSHLKKNSKGNPFDKKSYHIKVTGGKLYFLHLLIREDSTLDDLDSYLRAIWLECCGHMSSFEVKGKPKSNSWLMDTEEFGEDMDTKVGTLFKKGLKLDYDYDFGSTTRLEVVVMNEYFIDNKNGILLLSRNEPLKILCDLCNEKPAKVMCRIWHNKETFFCHSCKKHHAKRCEDFADYSRAEIINSPRVGVCGYDGGSIDTKRDGVWKG